MKCSSCQQSIRPDLEVCPLCGAAQPESVPEEEQVTRIMPPPAPTEQPQTEFNSEDWQPESLAEIPEEPVTEMFLEADWDPEASVTGASDQEHAEAPADSFPDPLAQTQQLPEHEADSIPTVATDPDGNDEADFEQTRIMTGTPGAAGGVSAADLAAKFNVEPPAPDAPTEWAPDAPPESGPEQPPAAEKQSRYRQLPVILAAIVALLAIAGGLIWLLGGQETPPAPQPKPVPPPPPPPVVVKPAPPAVIPELGQEADNEGPASAETLTGDLPTGSDAALPGGGEGSAAQTPGAGDSMTDDPTAEEAPPPPPEAKPKPRPKPKPKRRPRPKPKPKPAPPPEPAPAPEPAPPPPPAVPAWLTSLRAELAVCEQKSFFQKAICRERVRWSRCAPDRWDTVPECAVNETSEP